MPYPHQTPDAFDPTGPRLVPRYPHCDSRRQPCRALLTEILERQTRTARTKLGKAEIDRADRRLRSPRRGTVADERSCADALHRIRRATEDFRGTPPVFTAEEIENDVVPSLWERLTGFLDSLPHSGVLADGED